MAISNHIRSGCCAALLVLAVAAPAGASTATSASESALVQAVNAARAAHGLRPLRLDRSLTRAARSCSSTLMRRNALSHDTIAARVRSSGARGPVFGENLAWGTGSLASAREIVRSWLASPGHRAVLLRPGFSRIGVGAVVGTFSGHRGATVVTADFEGV